MWKRVLKITGQVLQIIYIVAMLTFSAVAIFSAKSGTKLARTPINKYTLLTVKTDSMKGEFDKDALVIGQIPTEKKILSLRGIEKDEEGKVTYEGDIISFKALINGKTAINTHRIIQVNNPDATDLDSISFITKGDNSAAADANFVKGSEVLAIYKSSVANVGGWIMGLKDGNTFIFLVILPLVILLLINVYIFFKNMSEIKAEKLVTEQGANVLSEEEKEKLKQEYLRSLEQEIGYEDKNKNY